MVDTVWKAAAYGDLPRLRALLAPDAALAEARDEAGFSPLQWAALNDRVEVVEALLELRADPNRRAALGPHCRGPRAEALGCQT